MRKIISLFTLALFVTGLVAAVPKPAAAQDEDPPGRVARLNYIQGSVSYQVSGDQDWVQADPNRPVTTGDSLWADKNSRGEVHIGSTAIRLSSETGISFLTLDDRTVQIQLAQGTIEVHVRNVESGDAFEIDTPNLAFTIDRGGEYRIQTDPNGDSTVIVVREGAGEVTGGGDSWDLRDGRMYTFEGTDQLSYEASGAPGYDDFEDWCESRDQRENSSASARYVSRDVDGYYDLDEYGDWHTDPDYGAVWVPRGVDAGWAPYQTGHWVFVAPWGWTWVDAEPWGFAPFHYGRWAFVGGYWGWVPGPIVVRPMYAPALVAFVGGGGFGVSVSFGGGMSGVGWFPLGPRDVFVPGYRCSPRYVQNVNITNTRVINVTQVTNVYNNHNATVINNYTYARNQRAVTAVSRETFVNARPVSGATVRVSADQIRGARIVETSPIAPTRTSYISSTARVSTNRPAVPFTQRAVVARLNPAVSRPVVQPSASGNDNRNGRFGRDQGNPQYNRGNNNLNNGQQPARGNTPPPVNNGNNAQQPVRGNTPPPAAVNNNGQQPPRGTNPPPAAVNNSSQQPARGNIPPPAVVNPNTNNGPESPRGNNPPPAAVNHNRNSPQNQQQSRDGYRPFQRPAGDTSSQPAGANNNSGSGNRNRNNANIPSNNNQNNNVNTNSANSQNNRGANRNDQTTQGDQRPAVRFTPPVKARDENYDVHPPLHQSQAQAPAKQEQRPEQKPNKENKKEDDTKDNKH
ncbi:MAG: DUF6600 domain-containing protein [Candidatus Acidiferrales bacterium]